MARSVALKGDSEQAGSVALAEPAMAMAWQRQPPQSTSRRSQLRQRSGIQSVPRKALNACEFSQISDSGLSLTLSKTRPGMVSAAWHGSTLPWGVMLIARRPQPPTQALGKRA